MIEDSSTFKKPFNLFLPRSHCPRCKHSLSWKHNIPLFSFLCLKGRCAYCYKKIASLYFFIELLTALSFLLIAVFFKQTPYLFPLLVFVSITTPLIIIDLQHQLLPDQLTLGLLWIGLLVNLFTTFAPLHDAVIGAAAGYLALWLIGNTYSLLTKKIGMGAGDFKLLAALGAWFGWMLLPWILFTAALLGIIIGGGTLLLQKKSFSQTIPFGPFLIIGALIVFFIMTWWGI
jgi:leader peptidase (prepilin peptidase)/N-methyltransferase